MEYHNLISVSVPTRHRPHVIKDFIESFDATSKVKPFLTVLHDAPHVPTENPNGAEEKPQCPLSEISNVASMLTGLPAQNIFVPDKSGLARLWNMCVMFAPTDWVLICNDDVVFENGWLEFLEDLIATDKYYQIDLACYAGFCIHKSMILKIGWFDEHFLGGAHEDHDWQLRITEANLRDYRTYEHNDKFLTHKTYTKSKWRYNGNDKWLCKKWKRQSPWDYRIPSFRNEPEVDWHPSYTAFYETKYNLKSHISEINTNVGSSREIFP